MKQIYHLKTFLLVCLMALVGSSAWATEETTTYVFNSKSWGATSGGSDANWTNKKEGNGFTSGQGVQVTSGKTGANADSPVSFTNVKKVVVVYNTNKSAGVGSIEITVGSETKSKDAKYAGSGNGTTANYEVEYEFNAASGTVNIKVNCSTKSIWVKSIAITTDDEAVTLTDPELAFAATSGEITFGETATLPALTNNGDGAVSYVSSDPSVLDVDSEGNLTVKAYGTAVVTATSAATATYAEGTAKYTLKVNPAGTKIFEEYFDTNTLSNYTTTSITYQSADNFAGGEAPEIMVGKSGVFTANVDLGGYYGTLVLEHKTNNTNAPFACGTAGVTVSEAQISGTTYYYTLTVPSGTASLALTWMNTTNSNNRLDDIVLYGTTRAEKESPALAFDKGTVTVAETEEGFEPVLAFDSSYDGEITFASSDEEVAMVDENTGDVVIMGTGTATITASATETATFLAANTSYTLKVLPYFNDIAELKDAWTSGNLEGILKLDDAEITYINGKNTYVRDASGALVFYNVSISGATAGMTMTGEAVVTYTLYGSTSKTPEITAFATRGEFMQGIGGTPEPIFMPNATDATIDDYDCNYIQVVGNISVSGANNAEIDGLVVYDKWSLIEDMTGLDEELEVRATGILVDFNGDPELCLLTLESAPANVDVDITDAAYATLYYSDRNLVVPADVEAYTYQLDPSGELDESFVYEEDDIIPAGTAVVLYSTEETAVSRTFKSTFREGWVDEDNILSGSDVEETTTGGTYFYKLSYNDAHTNVGFYWAEDGGAAFTNAAHKAYLATDNTFGIRGFVISGKDATGINTAKTQNANGKVYDLSGRRVNNAEKGVYIINGKKVIK